MGTRQECLLLPLLVIIEHRGHNKCNKARKINKKRKDLKEKVELFIVSYGMIAYVEW